jgi:CubicO group peptidase (beta-lactamase class C family)
LDAYLQERIFEPLGMEDTGYFVPSAKLDRLAALYGSYKVGEADMTATKWFGGAMAGLNRLLEGPGDGLAARPHQIFRGGHGLVSTAGDYLRFCQMLLNQGELDGERLLGRKTVELMTLNHLAPELLPFEMGGIESPGVGYGLGLRVVMDVAQFQLPGSVGDLSWGGAASTTFWIDPQEVLIAILMTQFQPSGFHLVGQDFRVMVYQALEA